MKRCLFVSLFAVIASSVAIAQDTAYKALRAIGAQRGEKALGQILSITGKSGRPEPMDWTIKLDDPAARGGVRELNIANTQITADRAPLKSDFPGSRPIDLTKLNLDSDGAFHVAEEEARRNQVGFDSVNYSLSSDPVSGNPVWILDLFDYDQQPVGAVRVAADSGKLIGSESWMPSAASGHYARQHAPLPEKPVGGLAHESSGYQESRPSRIPPPADYREPQYQDNADARGLDDSDNQAGAATVGERAHRFGARVADFGEKVLNKTERAARRIGGWFQKRVTGTDTISPPDESDADNPSAEPDSRPVPPAPED
jgi:hypothetical protein